MDAVDIHINQRVVITEFITAEVTNHIGIHSCLKSVCGEDATNGSQLTRQVSFESRKVYW